MKTLKISKRGISTVLVAGIIAIIVVASVAGVWYFTSTSEEPTALKVFCAGSLTLPLEEIETKFEDDNPNVDVQLEPGGSVTRVQKVTELGEQCDVLASADYSLIPSMMMTEDSNYADWYIIFAVNRMTLAYTSNSKYADEITADNWYDILRKSDVKWGFSDPNLDPCGYRSPMVIQLAEAEYGDDQIFEDLIEANSDITVSEDSGVFTIDANMSDLNPNTERLMIREKSVDLVTHLQEGGLDYAFEYSSVAKQHDLLYLDLPLTIDLSSAECANTYKKVKIAKTTTISTGKPIVYGLTVPNNAPNADLGAQFIEYIVNEFGQGVFNNNGQPPVVPGLACEIANVPAALQPYVVEYSESTTPEIPDLSLTMVDITGAETVLTEDDLSAMTSVEYDGGLMSSSGSIKSLGTYTGVALSTLCDMIGGINNETTLRVTASDGYSMVMTYDKLTEGNFITFDPTSGSEVTATQPMEVVLAYFVDGEPLAEGDGPLRLVAIGADGLVTEGQYWVKSVVKLEVRKAVKEWTLTLNGALVEDLSHISFEAKASKNYAEWTDDDSQVWSGMPLWKLVGIVDDEVKSGEGMFNENLADEGYTIRIIATDDYATELNSTFVKLNDNIIIAYQLDGEELPEKYWPLRLVGSDLVKSQMARNIAEIQLIF